ncbi:hypothetical protein HAX54_009851, partial [Datura stramonium]|nr:hypothetical protein [Datura stramonium]
NLSLIYLLTWILLLIMKIKRLESYLVQLNLLLLNQCLNLAQRILFHQSLNPCLSTTQKLLGSL